MVNKEDTEIALKMQTDQATSHGPFSVKTKVWGCGNGDVGKVRAGKLLVECEVGVADVDFVAVLQWDGSAGFDCLVVEECSVGRSVVTKKEIGSVEHQNGAMFPGKFGIFEELKVGFGTASKQSAFFFNFKGIAFAFADRKSVV